jgi:uncharacterized lipoprotein YmbA
MFNKVKIEDLQARIDELEAENAKLAQLGTRSVLELETQKGELDASVSGLQAQLMQLATELADKRAEIVETDDQAILQEAGFYQFSTVLDTAVAYAERNSALRVKIKTANRAGGNAVLGTTNWTVNGSKAAGQKMVNEVSKLMLRAYNGEVDDSVRTLKPYKLPAALDRLNKVRASIERLGKSMSIVINPQYHELRLQELRLTADFLRSRLKRRRRKRLSASR